MEIGLAEMLFGAAAIAVAPNALVALVDVLRCRLMLLRMG